ncbi:hypothetical protein ACQKGI_20530 [Peribacillus muralis]|uniref:hypothetical protein n=1 Tax=Peribacillus muralis TaxID=264697 RepID=UPI003828E353
MAKVDFPSPLLLKRPVTYGDSIKSWVFNVFSFTFDKWQVAELKERGCTEMK